MWILVAAAVVSGIMAEWADRVAILSIVVANGLLEGAASEDKTPLQKRLDTFGRLLVWVSLGIVGLIFALGLARGIPGLELFLTSASFS